MALRIPKACRHSFSIDLKAGTFLAIGASVVVICGIVLRKSLIAPQWLIIIVQSIQTGSLLFAPAWAGAAMGKQKVPLISRGATVSGLLLLMTGLAVPAVRYLWTGWHKFSFFGATPDMLLFALLLVLVYFSASGFLALVAAVYRQNYPVMIRAQILSRANVVKLFAGQAILITGSIMLDIEHGIFINLLILGSLCYVLGASIYSRMYVTGEMTLPRGMNWTEMRKRILPGEVYALLRRNPHFKRFQLCQTLHGSGNLMCGPAYILIMIDVLQLSYLEIVMISMVVPAVGNIISTMRWAPLVDRLSPCRARVRNSPLWIAGLVLFPLSVYLNNSLWAWLAFICTGFAMGGSGLIWSLGSLYYAGKEDATMYSAAHSFLTGVRGFVFVMIGGAFYVLFGTAVFYVGAAMMTMAMIMFHQQDKAERADPEFLRDRRVAAGAMSAKAVTAAEAAADQPVSAGNPTGKPAA